MSFTAPARDRRCASDGDWCTPGDCGCTAGLVKEKTATGGVECFVCLPEEDRLAMRNFTYCTDVPDKCTADDKCVCYKGENRLQSTTPDGRFCWFCKDPEKNKQASHKR